MPAATVKDIWTALSEPRSVTVMMAGFYVTCAAVGIWGLTIPATTGVRDLIAWLLVAGGVIAASGCPFGHWWIERPGITLLAAAFAARVAVLVGNIPPDFGYALLATGGVLALLVTRWIRIRALPKDPTRRAR